MTLEALIVTGLAAASITVAAQERMVMVGGESMLPSPAPFNQQETP